MPKSESERMVREAYETIVAIPPARIKPVVPSGWKHSLLTLQQMQQANLISKRQYLEQAEGLAFDG
jgi:hypothetical protein